MKITAYILTLFFFSISCSQKKEGQTRAPRRSVSKECIALNDAGVEELKSYYNSRNDSVHLDSAFVLLEKAVECDPDYFLANANMATVLSHMGKFDAAIVVVDKLLILSNNDPGTVVYKGKMLERQGKTEVARIQFALANKLYIERITEDPDNTPLIVGKISLTAYLEGKDKALAELEQYIVKYPDNLELPQYREELNKFKKENFLEIIGPMKK